MMDRQQAFGRYLRAQREVQQISLWEIAASTKIPLESLKNLENGSWEALPAEVFVRGFIRSYAQYVGLSGADACGRYEQALAQDEPAAEEAEQPVELDRISSNADRRRLGLALLVILVLILATITFSLFWRSGAGSNQQTRDDVSSIYRPPEAKGAV